MPPIKPFCWYADNGSCWDGIVMRQSQHHLELEQTFGDPWGPQVIFTVPIKYLHTLNWTISIWRKEVKTTPFSENIHIEIHGWIQGRQLPQHVPESDKIWGIFCNRRKLRTRTLSHFVLEYLSKSRNSLKRCLTILWKYNMFRWMDGFWITSRVLTAGHFGVVSLFVALEVWTDISPSCSALN